MLTLNKISITVILLVGTPVLGVHAHPLKAYCRYTPLSTSEVPLLSTSCPLGRGVWGDNHPKNSQSNFWVQCGVYPSPVKIQHIALLLQELKQPIWNKKSQSGYHCLIGPYNDYLSALKGQRQARKVRGFKDSALRELDLSTLKLPESSSVHIQRRFETPSYHVIVPLIMSNAEGQYREKGEQWGRMTFKEANRICQMKKLSLPNELFWQEASSSDVFRNYGLPHSVPYWGDNKLAFSSSGQKVTATEHSLLNVLCVGDLD